MPTTPNPSAATPDTTPDPTWTFEDACAEVLGIAFDFTDGAGTLYRRDLAAWMDHSDSFGDAEGQAANALMRRALDLAAGDWGNVTYNDTDREFARLIAARTAERESAARTAERDAIAEVLTAHQHIGDDFRCSCGIKLRLPVFEAHATHIAEQIQALLSGR